MKRTFVKRGRLEVIYDILSVSRRPTQKTRILYACNLSYDMLQKYLRYLSLHGLLSSSNDKGKERYEATEKGKEFIREYECVNSFLKEKQNSVVVRNIHSSIHRN